jgi:formylglycine-generating enzyme required for sulfatase activity
VRAERSQALLLVVVLSNPRRERLPIICVNWCEAYAFCIWDGGFLQSETEWKYAASGGSKQRECPSHGAPRHDDRAMSPVRCHTWPVRETPIDIGTNH